jgi:hypothetical protein
MGGGPRITGGLVTGRNLLGRRAMRALPLIVAVLGLLLLAARPAGAAITFQTKWGTEGAGDGQFEAPEGVAVGPGGDVYVADTGNDRVQRFDPDGGFLGKWGSSGTGNGEFDRAYGIAPDFAGNVYVAEAGNNRVQKFSASGSFIAKWGTFGNADGRFSNPTGIAVDSIGNVYVADAGNYRVQKFGPSGNFLAKWGIRGSGDGQFEAMAGIAVDSIGNVYVADAGNYRVQKFDSNGVLLGKFGTQGSAPGQFDFPYGVSIDGSGDVFVVDVNNSRFQKFEPGFSVVGIAGQQGSGDGQFQNPAGIAATGGRDIYVADVYNHRIQRFVQGGAIVVRKDSQPDDPQDFDFTTGGGLVPPSFQLDDDGDELNGLTSRRVFAVDPGSGYSVAETVPDGWDQTGASCSDGSPPSNIDVSDGETVTCTFTNTKRSRIVVVEDAQPNDPQDFSFTAGGGLSPSSFQLDDDRDNSNALSNTRTFDNVVPGSGYSISQATPPGWGVADATCSDGSSPSNIDVAAGEVVTCTFANLSDTAGRIVVRKDAQPDDPQDWSFTAGGGLSPSSFQLDDDGDNSNGLSNTRTFVVAPQSGYSISEAAPPAGWDLSSATCSDGSPPSNIDVGPSETVTCTFTNRRRGQIVVVKDATPDDPQDFSFTAGGGLSPSSFQLDDDSDGTLSSTRTFADVVPGAGYSVAESVPSGWDQTSATCSDGSPPSNIDVAPAETVTCTFANRKRGRIVVVKDAIPDDPQDFSFTAGGGLSPSSFQLDDDSDGTLSNTQTFTDVVPGSGYSIAESAPPGWVQVSASCSDGSPPSSVNVAPAETVTCTFTNRKSGRITVIEDAIPDDPQDWSFTAGSGLSPSSFQLDDDGDNSNTLSNTRTFADLVPGSGYSISQQSVAGWVQDDATCSDGSPPSSIDIAPGEAVTCTFSNSRRGKIVVRKDAQPNDDQDFDFTAGGGLSPSAFQLDDDGDETNALKNTRSFVVNPGSGYSVAESAPPVGWEQRSAACSDGSPISNIDVSLGETVTCTFVNVTAAYVRPKAASPFRVPLLPAYQPCGPGTANRTHGPPLGFPSCNPPVLTSNNLTPGEPTVNGAAANMVGSVKLVAVPGVPGGPDDADVKITVSVTDVRCKVGVVACGSANAADGPDYTGELLVDLTLRITDRLSTGGQPGTVQDISFQAIVQCAATPADTIGSTCSATTSADTLQPGAAPEGKRSVWELGQVRVFDGGPDGSASTAGDNTVYLRQGVFIP